METPVLLAGAAVLILVACVLGLVLRSRAESRRELAEAKVEAAALYLRLDRLSEQLERQSSTMIRVDDPAYVITDAGRVRRDPNVPDRVVLSAAVGEPLVKVVAFGHGLARAMSAESRNRIRFEVRREVRRSRKQRRRDMKDAWRRLQAADRATSASVSDQGATDTPPQPADAA